MSLQAHPTASVASVSSNIVSPETLNRVSLLVRLRAEQRRRVRRSLLIASPLLLFLGLAFLYPMATMLWRAFDNHETSSVLISTADALDDWDGASLPSDTAYNALARDISRAKHEDSLNGLMARLNQQTAGFRSLLLSTARKLPDDISGVGQQEMLAIDERWGEISYWQGLQSAAFPFTLSRILAVFDLEQKAGGNVTWASPDRQVYLDYLVRTLWISLSVTFICVVLGYPMAYMIADARGRRQSILLAFILLPFWTSLLVRTAAWVVLLQKEGIINGLLVGSGLLHQPAELIFNRFGVYVAMTHVLLPFMVMPLYSVMKGIDGTYMRAATSLGAGPVKAFLTVYLPQTVPGIAAGALLVFVLANGFYITPALVGGAQDQMLSALIADFAIGRANWGMASALAIVLLISVGLVFVIFSRLLQTRSFKL